MGRGHHRVPQRGRAPRHARSYLQYISDFVKVPVALISVGPGREQVIWTEAGRGMYGSGLGVAAERPSAAPFRRLVLDAVAAAVVARRNVGAEGQRLEQHQGQAHIQRRVGIASDALCSLPLDLLGTGEPLLRLVRELLEALPVELQRVGGDVRLVGIEAAGCCRSRRVVGRLGDQRREQALLGDRIEPLPRFVGAVGCPVVL